MLEYVIFLFQKQYGTNLPLKDRRLLLICLTKLSDTMNNQIHGPDKLQPASRALTTWAVPWQQQCPGTWCPSSYVNLTEHAGERTLYILELITVSQGSLLLYISQYLVLFVKCFKQLQHLVKCSKYTYDRFSE